MRTRLAFFALALMLPTRSSADTLSGTKATAMYEKADTIELKVAHGHATFVVRRTFENRSTEHDQAMLHIDRLPIDAVATGLRTLGGTAQNPVWFNAELMDAEAAAKKYRELTGIGGYYPKDPALLSWRSADHLALQVFPVAPKSEKTVEYTLEAPTIYENGRFGIVVPRMGTPSFAPTLKVSAAESGDALFLDGMPIASGDTRKLLGDLGFSVAPKDPPKLGGRLATVGFGKQRTLVHVAIEASRKLSEKPKDAWIVLMIDGSRSMRPSERQATLLSAQRYLAHLPDAHVQVLVFDRVVHPLEASFVTVSQAIDDLKKAKIDPKNGSDLDVVLADAATRIAAAPTSATRRMMLFTDLKTRSSLLPEKVQNLTATKAILHVATPALAAHETSLRRDDHAPWSLVPRATGGVLWDVDVNATPNAHDLAVLEEWARPLRIDRLSISGAGLDVAGLGLPDTLAEGEGFDELRLAKGGPAAVDLKGELWSTPISTRLTTNATEEKLWSGLAIASSLLWELKDPEIAALAFKGGVVSPMTSFLAVEPGVRPSTEGLDWGAGGLGMSGVGSGGAGMGFGSGSAKAPPPDRTKYLRDTLAKIVAGCGGGEVRARLETTLDEIVSVDVVPKVPSAALASCVREGLFAHELPSWFDASWQAWDVSA